MNAERTTSFSAEDPADETARATSERLGASATAANREYGDWGETFATAERQHFYKWQAPRKHCGCFGPMRLLRARLVSGTARSGEEAGPLGA